VSRFFGSDPLTAHSVKTKDFLKRVDTTLTLEITVLTLRIRTYLLGLTMH